MGRSQINNFARSLGCLLGTSPRPPPQPQGSGTGSRAFQALWPLPLGLSISPLHHQDLHVKPPTLLSTYLHHVLRLLTSVSQGYVHDKGQHHGDNGGTGESQDGGLVAWEGEGVTSRTPGFGAECSLLGGHRGEKINPTRAFFFSSSCVSTFQ